MSFMPPAQYKVKTVARKIVSIFERMDRGERPKWCVVYNLFTCEFRVLEEGDERSVDEMWVVVDCDTWDLYEEIYRGWKRSYAELIEKTTNMIYYHIASYLDWDCYFNLDDEVGFESKKCIRLVRQMIEELNRKDICIMNGYVKIQEHAGPLSCLLSRELAC